MPDHQNSEKGRILRYKTCWNCSPNTWNMLKHVETTSFNLCSRSSILGEHYNLGTSCPTVCLVTVKSIAGTTAAQLRGSTSVNQASLRYWSEDIGIVVTFHHPCRTQTFHGHHWEAGDDCASQAAQWSVKRARGILFFKSVESNGGHFPADVSHIMLSAFLLFVICSCWTSAQIALQRCPFSAGGSQIPWILRTGRITGSWWRSPTVTDGDTPRALATALWRDSPAIFVEVAPTYAQRTTTWSCALSTTT